MWMNVNYLLQHVSYSLHTIVRDYGETRQLQENFCGRPDFTDSSFFHGNLEESLLAQSGEVCCCFFYLRGISWSMPWLRFQSTYLSSAR